MKNRNLKQAKYMTTLGNMPLFSLGFVKGSTRTAACHIILAWAMKLPEINLEKENPVLHESLCCASVFMNGSNAEANVQKSMSG